VSRQREDREVTDVPIRDAVIRLGQFLKLAGAVESGADVKRILALDDITVNGVVEHRRGRQLVKGDEVALGDLRFTVS
jgi:ribosome-associated protein